ncbi:hypothetical protein NEILACOT_04830 [Neisseria lactamica ATCC 23970]|uniref:Uncharacterized protein n=2 Tax=Neisseria lactamica TaxID=486 RepID=D0WBA5_NEILA|nr:hypothetical protein B2G52_04395 [Neisseria lactamica]EEZ75161.1 hypothetical protein NEILACOT_04830 [Neisseria lactamica ATCC 23970]
MDKAVRNPARTNITGKKIPASSGFGLPLRPHRLFNRPPYFSLEKQVGMEFPTLDASGRC